MIKLVCLIRRRDDVSGEDFRAWWLGHHTGVAAQLPGLRRYRVSPAARGEAPYDGLAELWFDDEAAMERAFASPEGARCAEEDRTCFGARLALVTEEAREIRLTPASPRLLADRGGRRAGA